MRHALATLGLAALIVIGCSSDEAVDDTAPTSTSEAPGDTAAPLPPDGRPELLSEWGQLVADGGQLQLGDGVTPYSLNTALFSDYAHKLRTVWLPDGSEPAVYDSTDVFDFPVGTVFTKTFYYPLPEGESVADARVLRVAQPFADVEVPLSTDAVRLVETRVLAHREDGWVALPYVWNEDQTKAELKRAGDLQRLTLVDDGEQMEFPYVVPDANQCAGCHATNHTTKLTQPIGPKARHLNLDVDLGDGLMPQLGVWQERGLLSETPDLGKVPRAAVWDDDSASIDDRARAYLDVNCAHCHNTVGPADTSGLFLESSTEVGSSLGVCKAPIAAGGGTGGRLVGIHPGEPDQSIFVYRMETEDPGAMMPELGRAIIHSEGVALISEWIESLDGGCEDG